MLMLKRDFFEINIFKATFLAYFIMLGHVSLSLKIKGFSLSWLTNVDLKILSFHVPQ
jgi:hypothetical protein